MKAVTKKNKGRCWCCGKKAVLQKGVMYYTSGAETREKLQLVCSKCYKKLQF
jgi:hypothetical protein